MSSDNDMIIEPSSFRDPSGFVYMQEGRLYRQINSSYQKQYDRLISSGLYEVLVGESLLIKHEEIDNDSLKKEDAYRIICPEYVPFISYPYEWSFGQYKDAAITTLRLHKRALEYGMILKDASAYNIQFYKGAPCLIDTLSFDFYHDGEPWVAYGQFCRHFLVPLLLMAKVDLRMSGLMRVFIDGIPLDLASALLKKKRIGFIAGQHIHWHAMTIRKHEETGKKGGGMPEKRLTISKSAQIAMIDSLTRLIEKLNINSIETEWGDYYKHTNYSDNATGQKEKMVASLLEEISPKTLWDMGANDGRYSRLASEKGIDVVAFDIDPVATEKNYAMTKSNGDYNLLPLILDLANPSPDIGFANVERRRIQDRQKPETIMMLAVIHHMAISNNLSLQTIAKWLSSLAMHLIIEFVPKEDSQVKILLATRDDIFPNYTIDGFEEAFGLYYDIKLKKNIDGTERILYHMTTKA